MAGYISGKQYWRVCYWSLPKHFPLLLWAERGTFCCTVVHQDCFFPLICYCVPRSSIVLRAILLGALSAALLIAGNFLFLAHSGSLFLNVCVVNTGSHILVGACVGFFPSAGVGGLYSAYLHAWMCFYTTIQSITLLTGVRVTVHLSSRLDTITKPPWLWKGKALWLL